MKHEIYIVTANKADKKYYRFFVRKPKASGLLEIYKKGYRNFCITIA